jgi:hypothetical protein
MKIAISTSIGTFRLSPGALARLGELVGTTITDENRCDYESREARSDPLLIQVCEELGAEANGGLGPCQIKVVEIPDDVVWKVEENECGQEWVAEKHRRWS